MHVSDVQSLTQALYNRPVTVTPLPGELDLNFKLTTDDGIRYVLKIMRPDCDPGLIDLQTKLLQHIAQHAPDLTVPHVIPNVHGEVIAERDGRLVWMLSWIDGTLMAHVKHHEPVMLENLGRTLAQLDQTLKTFDHPAAHRQMKWDLSRPHWIADYIEHIPAEDRPFIEAILADFSAVALEDFGCSIIHNDANDYNIIVNGVNGMETAPIDFGDTVYTHTINELAIACAYALLDKRDPIDSCTHLIRGYHAVLPLTGGELSALFTLIKTRLAVSVTNSAHQKTLNPDDPYIVISERPAWDALHKLKTIHPTIATAKFRHACGFDPYPNTAHIVAFLDKQQVEPVIKLAPEQLKRLDLGIDSLNVQWDDEQVQWAIMDERLDTSAVYIGGYNEARLIYANEMFGAGHPTNERRTVHLGVDIWTAAGTPVYAPLAGVVHTVTNNNAHLDYGPVIILAHETDDGVPFYTLYGHLSADSLTMVQVGQAVTAGQQIGTLGAPPINGDWPPHLHIQLIVDLLDMGNDFPGVALATERDIWLALSPNPHPILNVSNDDTGVQHIAPVQKIPKAETLRLRQKYLGRNLSISYRNPLKIVRGHRQYLYDETGRAFLDCYNNVAHVGHTHPQVVAAVQEQAALLNTNTRYLHDNLVRYAKRLVATLPQPLSVVYIVNSGSEANELALRLAHTYTNSKATVVLDNAYHGHTTTLIDVSPYKHNGPGGKGAPDWVYTVPVADDYRGEFKRSDPEAGRKFAGHVRDTISRIAGDKLSCFMAETLPSVGGQIVFPPGYLTAVQQHVHAAGGVMIADEVQVGFGRLGTHYWGFETQNCVPDIVAMGKPIANGFPMAAVVTTPEIADAFDNGMEYFATFGGNPVSVAAGLAVMDVIEQEQLQENARLRGEQLLDGFRQLQARHDLIGDVRGMGLFLGLELVRDRETLQPAGAEAADVVNRLRERGVLAGTDGPFHNVIKLRGPMCFDEADARLLIQLIDWALP